MAMLLLQKANNQASDDEEEDRASSLRVSYSGGEAAADGDTRLTEGRPSRRNQDERH